MIYKKLFLMSLVFALFAAAPVLAQNSERGSEGKSNAAVSVSGAINVEGDPIPDIDITIDQSARVSAEQEVNEDESSERENNSAETRGAASARIKAVEVRGWDPEKKREFMMTVKSHAELRSGQDLENFAAGVLLNDENIKELELADGRLAMGYRMSAKLFGLFSTSLNVRTEMKNDGEIKAKFPWYGFLYRKYISVDDIEAAIAAELGVDSEGWEAPSADDAAKRGMMLKVMSDILKAHHEMQKSIIANIRA
jgi:hypothetical protein